MAYGHYLNYSNFKFWQHYVCHSMNQSAHSFAFKFFSVKFIWDSLFAYNNLIQSKIQFNLHILASICITIVPNTVFLYCSDLIYVIRNNNGYLRDGFSR